MFVVKLLINLLIFIGLYNLVKSSSDYEEFVCPHVHDILDTSVCVHGAYWNSCPDQKLQCYKGLDERCGMDIEREIIQGKCAPELMCCNSKCTGCRIGECSQSKCDLGGELDKQRGHISNMFTLRDMRNHFKYSE